MEYLRVTQQIERITCHEAGCAGCRWVHRRPVGEVGYFIATERSSKAAYEEAMSQLKDAIDG